ncbi:hypothetical protein [Metabacillus arenae]|uniref:Uncharacterized protein n=1 Tax=Metabacillus arenae TaxID=2771434 RepID=A0A926RWD0_9BACI|nr:hypothetical protein [Metabacillus arenae]MBD1379052.1 hypothetical protein [Metabacillus arenae]
MEQKLLSEMKSLVFDYADDEVSKVEFVYIMLEHISSLQIEIESKEKIKSTLKESNVLMRERPIVAGEDAERFLERVKENDEKLKKRNEHLRKSIETYKKIERKGD